MNAFSLSHQQRSARFAMRATGGALLSLALLLSGCASVTPHTETSAISSARSYQHAIEIEGRLSLQYQQQGQDESLHGSFTWQQQDDQHSTLTLRSPLGQVIATIAIAPGIATLTESGKAPRAAGDVDALVAQSLGWPLPIAGLQRWLQGFAMDANGNPFIAHGEGSVVTTQDSWQLRYANWQQAASGQTYARRIDLTRQTAQAGKVDLRIVIDNWQPRP